MSYLTANYEHLKINFNQGVMSIVLNREKASHAYSQSMTKDLPLIVRCADKDDSVKVVTLTSVGKNFCAGGDIKSMQEQSGMFAGNKAELKKHYEEGIQQISKAFYELSKVVIVGVQGAAVGAGCDLALMGDIRIGTPRTKFIESFPKVGLLPGDGGCYFLIRAVGFSRASEMLLGQRVYQGEEALKVGLLHECIEEGQLNDRVFQKALELSKLPANALCASKKALTHAYQHDLVTHLEYVGAVQPELQRSSEHFEALNKLLKK